MFKTCVLYCEWFYIERKRDVVYLKAQKRSRWLLNLFVYCENTKKSLYYMYDKREK